MPERQVLESSRIPRGRRPRRSRRFVSREVHMPLVVRAFDGVAGEECLAFFSRSVVPIVRLKKTSKLSKRIKNYERRIRKLESHPYEWEERNFDSIHPIPSSMREWIRDGKPDVEDCVE
ncbi:unnamed protein product [Cochlearia groenlandica]